MFPSTYRDHVLGSNAAKRGVNYVTCLFKDQRTNNSNFARQYVHNNTFYAVTNIKTTRQPLLLIFNIL